MTARWTSALATALALAIATTAMMSSTVAYADDAAGRSISLAEAQAVARRGNDVRAAQAVAVAQAAARVRASDGVDDLVIEASAEALGRRSEPSAGPFFQETALGVLGGRIGVWKPLPAGGRIGLQVRDEVVRTEARLAAGGPVLPLDYTVHAPRVELRWDQPLLRGRGRAVHEAPRRRARAEAEAEVARLAEVEDQLRVEVATAYWELAYAAREVTIRAGALALAGEQLAITQARTEVGRGAGLEVLAVEQAVAAREAALVEAEQAVAARALALRVLLALDDGDGRPLVASDALEGAGPAPPPLAEALARTLATAPALRAIDHQLRAAGVAIEAAARAQGPRLDLMVRGGPAGNADDAGAAWAQLGRFDGYEAGAALTFSLPVGDRQARGEHAAARLERQRLTHERAAVRGRLTAAVQRAVDAVTLSERRIAAATRAAALATRTVALEQARWQTGAGTNFDVLTRQDQAAAAAAGLARAHADRQRAQAVLAALLDDGA